MYIPFFCCTFVAEMERNMDYNRIANAEIVRVLGANFRQYRLRARLTQEEVATLTGVSIFTIRKFETGKATNLSVQTLLALLRAVDQINAVAALLPPLPPNPEQIFKNTSDIKRVRHGN